MDDPDPITAEIQKSQAATVQEATTAKGDEEKSAPSKYDKNNRQKFKQHIMKELEKPKKRRLDSQNTPRSTKKLGRNESSERQTENIPSPFSRTTT